MTFPYQGKMLERFLGTFTSPAVYTDGGSKRPGRGARAKGRKRERQARQRQRKLKRTKGR